MRIFIQEKVNLGEEIKHLGIMIVWEGFTIPLAGDFFAYKNREYKVLSRKFYEPSDQEITDKHQYVELLVIKM